MPHALRRRLLRSTLALALVVGGAAIVAQLAGVTGSSSRSGTQLVFGERTNEWLVQLPEASGDRTSGKSLGRAMDRLGGGKSGGALPGGWHAVRLGEDITSSEAERAFGDAGALNVEPVVPRVAYDLAEPDAVGDSAVAPRTTTAPAEPDAVSDPASAFPAGSFGDALRNGTLQASRLGEQWSLEQASDVDIDGTEAWNRSTGSGAIVAVIDTGVDATHPDLRGRVLEGYDFSGADTGATSDVVGHGTHVASIIAAGGTAMAGVAPDAKIMPLKVFADSASRFSMDGYIRAIRYAADNGADVINISLGCGGTASCYSQAEFDAISYANDRGVVLVAASGNGDASGVGMNNDATETPDFPSGYDLPNIVSVTSSTKLGGWSTWANYGARGVDLAAPGESILVARPGTSYTSVTGTSFSAPHVSAAIGLLAAARPTAKADELRATLLSAVDKVGELTTRSVSGGTLNADAALRATLVPSAAAGGRPTQVAPRQNAKLASPPTLTWKLPARWKSVRVELRGPGGSWATPVTATRRALAQPKAAWRSGTYRWRVVARGATGAPVATAWRAYRVAPRTDSLVTSGRLASGGATVRLRVAYASTEPKATTRIRVLAGGKVVHSGTATRRSSHARGTGFPRRGWFAYTAKLSRSLAPGAKVVVEVTVRAGSATSTHRFRATVA